MTERNDVVWLCKEVSFLNMVATLQKQIIVNYSYFLSWTLNSRKYCLELFLYDLTNCHLKMKRLTPYLGSLADTQMEGCLWSYYMIYPCLLYCLLCFSTSMKENLQSVYSQSGTNIVVPPFLQNLLELDQSTCWSLYPRLSGTASVQGNKVFHHIWSNFVGPLP